MTADLSVLLDQLKERIVSGFWPQLGYDGDAVIYALAEVAQAAEALCTDTQTAEWLGTLGDLYAALARLRSVLAGEEAADGSVRAV